MPLYVLFDRTHEFRGTINYLIIIANSNGKSYLKGVFHGSAHAQAYQLFP